MVSGELLDRQLLFVTGKGGTGKTSVAAALAVLAAHSGQRVLVCEIDAKGALAGAFDIAELDFEPTLLPLAAGAGGPATAGRGTGELWAMAMNTEDSLREYLRLFVRLPLVGGRLGPLAKTFDFVADAAPGVKEILGVGKLAYEVRERHYDLVVVDAEASGHAVAQIAAPRVIGELVQVGMVRDQARWMLDILEDPQRTGVVVVTTPEEMPVVETLDLLERLAAESDVAPLAVVANRVLPSRFAGEPAALLEALDGSGLATLTAAIGKGASALVLAARLAEARHATGAAHLERLRGELPAGLAVLEVPELFTRASGPRVVMRVAEALGRALGVGTFETGPLEAGGAA